jgi:hypothetical protein
MDRDGDIEATSSNYEGGSVGVYRNNGTGTQTLATTLFTSISGSYTWAHDLDGDGDLDLSVVDEESDELFVFLNCDTGTDAADPPDGLSAWGPSLHAAPNPLRPGRGARITLAHALDLAEARPPLDVYDVAGRQVRRIEAGPSSGKTLQFDWDGTTDSGQPLAAGRYFAVLVLDGRRLVTPVDIAR